MLTAPSTLTTAMPFVVLSVTLAPIVNMRHIGAFRFRRNVLCLVLFRNKQRIVLQHRNRFSFLIDATIWCRILVAVHSRPQFIAACLKWALQEALGWRMTQVPID